MKKIIVLISCLLIIFVFNTSVVNALTSGEILSKVQEDLFKGNALYEDGKYGEALQAYKDAEKLDSKNIEIYYNEGLSLMKLNKYDEAIQAFNNVLKINTNSIASNYQLGLAYEKLSKGDQAKSCYQKAVDLVPQSASGYFYHGKSLEKLGRTKDAQLDLEQAGRLDSQYETKSQSNADNSQQESIKRSFTQDVKDFISYSSQNNNQYKLIFLIIIVITANIVIVIFNRKNRKEETISGDVVIKYVQTQLNLPSFTKEDSSTEEGTWYPKTRETLKTWSKVQLENAYNRIKTEFENISSEKLLDINLLIEQELKSREGVDQIESNIFDDVDK